jgi:hypothetical protein
MDVILDGVLGLGEKEDEAMLLGSESSLQLPTSSPGRVSMPIDIASESLPLLAPSTALKPSLPSLSLQLKETSSSLSLSHSLCCGTTSRRQRPRYRYTSPLVAV